MKDTPKRTEQISVARIVPSVSMPVRFRLRSGRSTVNVRSRS